MKAKMNIKLLRQVQAHILEEPRRLQMATWIRWRNRFNDRDFFDDDDAFNRGPTKFAECGTAACIGGWAVLLSGRDPNHVQYGMGEEATQVLGLSHEQAPRLFGVSAWPTKFKSAYRRAIKQETLAKITSGRIDHFIKTRGRE